MDYVIPAEVTVVVPDRCVMQWHNGDYTDGVWRAMLRALGHGWYTALTIKTTPMTALENVCLMYPWGQVMDRWAIVPGSSVPLLLPVKPIQQGHAHEELVLEWRTPHGTPEYNLQVGTLFVSNLEMEGHAQR